MTEPSRALSIPVEEAFAACSDVALETLAGWMEAGAVLKPSALVTIVGKRVMASIDFERPVSLDDRTCNGFAVPLVVTLYDGEAGADMLARVKAGDDLVLRLREMLVLGAAA